MCGCNDNAMPMGRMDDVNSGAMPAGDMHAASGMEQAPGGGGGSSRMPGEGPGKAQTSFGPGPAQGPVAVMVEMRAGADRARESSAYVTEALTSSGFQADLEFTPIPMVSGGGPGALETAVENTVIIRGTVDPAQIAALEARPDVVKVWLDTPVAPFSAVIEPPVESEPMVAPMEGFGPCPIGVCDCSPGTPKGNIADVANYLGVNQIWAAGIRGEGMVVGVVDGGITAQGRPIQGRDTSDGGWPNKLVPRVIGGWPVADWGTTGVDWGWHGNMCATDVLGMAPAAQIYDIRISAGSAVSLALSGFQWAIDRHRADGTPHVLTNSWGIFQETWDAVYARDPNHPFTRKVVEALNEGILVLFAAGNCGHTCPDGRCGPDTGGGRSIWGANGHPRVITVGAVNKNEQYVGYSSQGPAALDPNKPDFCSITHFTGFFNSDSGTSAATPIAAGVVALLKQANAGATQDQIKTALKSTAKDIGPAGFDQLSGSGIIRAKAAYDTIARPAVWSAWESLGGFITDGVGVSSWAPNRLDCFAVGNDRALWHRWWDGAAWRGWESLGGNIYSNPAAVSWGVNRIDVFAIGGDRAMYHRWWDGAAWRGWESLGGFVTDGIGVSSWGVNRLDCFAVGNDRALWHRWWDGAAWRGWESLGGNIYSDPAAVSWGPNRIDVFAIGGDRAVWHRWWDGAAWRGWESLGGFTTDGVAVSSKGPNKLDVFAIGNDRAVWRRSWNGVAWSAWTSVGGGLYSNPAAVSWGPGRVDLFAIGGNRALWHRAEA